MRNDTLLPRSIAACLDRVEGSVFLSGTVSHLLTPGLVDPLHIMVGAGCDEWGLCLFLTVADAAKLHVDLGRLLADHAARG